MNFISRLWGASPARSIEPCKPARTAPSPRIWDTERTFIIEASLTAFRESGPCNGPILYLNTRCAAIADYCLLGRRSIALRDEEQSLRLDTNGVEHSEVCLRMRRCGAVRVSPKNWMYTEQCEIAFAHQLDGSRYLFGWPDVVNSTDGGEAGNQPVWVYHIWRDPTDLPRMQSLRHTGMEGHLGVDWLVGCSTMEEYCEMLKVHGAIYYGDASECPPVREMGLVDRATTIEDLE